MAVESLSDVVVELVAVFVDVTQVVVVVVGSNCCKMLAEVQHSCRSWTKSEAVDSNMHT